jgi:transcriptional regulator with XRE-family HTH domain
MAAMISPRAPRDGDRSRKTLLPSCCRAIGAQLTATRDTRQISVEAVASKLLLSRGQILGLEHGDSSPFYNTGFFLRGLRKYMALLGLPADLLVDDDQGGEEEGGLRLLLADTSSTSAAPAAAQGSPRAAATAAILVLAVGGGYLVTQGGPWRARTVGTSDVISLASMSPLPAEPIRLPAEPPLPVRAEPAVATPSRDAASVRVSVGKSTWVFVKYPDNRIVERRLEAGEELDLGPLPVYLAVGTADSVEVRVENRPVALGPYIKNGQVRLTQPELARLVP